MKAPKWPSSTFSLAVNVELQSIASETLDLLEIINITAAPDVVQPLGQRRLCEVK